MSSIRIRELQSIEDIRVNELFSNKSLKERRVEDEYERMAHFVLALCTGIFEPDADDAGSDEGYELWRCERR